MPASILPQDQVGQELFNSISSFFCRFGIGNLLRKCNAQKEKGVPFKFLIPSSRLRERTMLMLLLLMTACSSVPAAKEQNSARKCLTMYP